MKLIITADWHLRATAPRCRIDEDWIKTQKDTLKQIADYAIKYKAKVCVVGDIFHTNTDTSFEVINMVQEIANYLKSYDLDGLYILAGNHDLPYHNSENINKSAIGLLLNSDNIFKLNQLVSKTLISAPNFDEKVENREIIFRHILVMPDEKRNPLIDCKSPQDLLDETSNAKWIFTGDYHHNFIYKNNNKYVINPGCIIRQVSDMKDYQCGIYLIDTNNEEIKFLLLQDRNDIIDDSYIIKDKDREERIEKFANKLADTNIVSLDFVENIKNSILENKLSDELKDVIFELLSMGGK
jgi:predicted phosphodiesterase